MWRDIRCRGSWKGGSLGGHCTQLLARIDASTVGAFQIKCPRCKMLQTVKIQTPAVPAGSPVQSAAIERG